MVFVLQTMVISRLNCFAVVLLEPEIKVPHVVSKFLPSKAPKPGVQGGLKLLVDKDLTLLPFVKAVCLQEGLTYHHVKDCLRDRCVRACVQTQSQCIMSCQSPKANHVDPA